MNNPRNVTSFGFHVCVDGEELSEYVVDDSTYVEANLHSPSSYIIRDKDGEGSWQDYPVTPFTIKGFFNNCFPHPCYLRLSIDGEQVWMKPFPSGAEQMFTVKGQRQHNEIHELLFTLPMITSQKNHNLSKWKKDLLGTITLECLEAMSDGVFYKSMQKFQENIVPGGLRENPALKPASKGDCSDTKQGSIGVSARQGRNIARFEKGHRQVQMVRYRLGQRHYGTVTVKYRPRIFLQEELGIEDPKWAVEEKKKKNKRPAESPDKNFEKENQVPVDENANKMESSVKEENCSDNTIENNENNPERCAKQEESEICEGMENLLTERPRKMYCFSPSVKMERKMDAFSPTDFQKNTKKSIFGNSVRIKKELEEGSDSQQYRMIEIDDDLCILEEIDDDVVWMGDDSCCFMDVTPPEIPTVDLIDDC